MNFSPDDRPPLWRRAVDFALIPAALFVAFVLLAHRLGLWEIEIQPNLYQLLDSNELKNHPFNSLLYLHSQPPGFNALFALILNLSDFTGIREEVFVKILFLAGGLIGAVLLFNVIRRVSDSTVLASLSVLALLSNPAYHVHAGMFFYPFILHFLFLILIWLVASYLGRESTMSLFLIVLLIALITNIRTLFHPVWAVGLFIIVIYGKMWISAIRDRKELQGFGLAFLSLLLLLSAWPLKNYLVFGQFTYSSWSGYSLSRALPVKNEFLEKYVYGAAGVVSEEVEDYLEKFRPVFKGDSLDVISAPRKSDGSLNWNHIVFVMTNRNLRKRALEWRLNNIRPYLQRTVFYYFIWTRPSYIHPYEGYIIGPKTDGYRRYAETYYRLIDADVRPFVEVLTPNLFLHRMAYVRGIPIEYTLYGLVFLPLLLVSAAAFIVLNLTKRRPREIVVTACAFCHIFPMVAACLTDGLEGNRMSFSTSPLLIIVAAYVIHESIAAAHALTGRARSLLAQTEKEKKGENEEHPRA